MKAERQTAHISVPLRRPAIGDRFPIKRTIGESVLVKAGVHAGGHDVISAVILYRPVGRSSWAESPMVHLGNDNWQGDFIIERARFSAWYEMFPRSCTNNPARHGTFRDCIDRLGYVADKPYPFWEWMIGEIREEHPDVLFVGEVFTRPKVMYRLAKFGFAQSYTYFTWRYTKKELAEYFTELTQSEVRELPALQRDASLRFHLLDNEHLIAYSIA